MSRDITWGDIKACVNHLSTDSLPGTDREEFAPLHRHEGGFMCVSGPGFQTTEPVDSKLDHQPSVRADGVQVRKFIRFEGDLHNRWPSRNHSFLNTPNLRDNTVVFPIVKTGIFSLRFEGQNCKKWTPAQCEEFGSIIAEEVQASPIHGNFAAKVKNGALGKAIMKKKRCARSESES